MLRIALLSMMVGVVFGEELFDGKSLDGWAVREGEEKFWRVEEGVIVGGSRDEKVPHNTFLTTARQFEDFELRLEVKVVGERPNAGVQFRSVRVENHHEMSGYQADVGPGLWGRLYDESRRNRFLAPWASKEAVGASKEGWNQMRIRAEGKRVRIWVNEVLTVDYEEKEEGVARSGLIGLQAHSGPAFEVFYRKIVIKELGEQSDGKESAID